MFLLAACNSTHVASPDLRLPYKDVVETQGKFRDDLRQRDVPIHTYSPVGAKPPFPIVIISPDYEYDKDLGPALARAGFYTVHLTRVAVDNRKNRALDVSFVLDKLAEDNLLDIDRVAVVSRAAQRDKRVKVIVKMSGSRTPATIAAFLRASLFK